MATVGIVGLGLLGGAIAGRFLAAGHAVVGHDMVPARLAALTALGGKPADSPAAVARAAEAVFTVLPSLAAVEEVILGPTGLITVVRPEPARDPDEHDLAHAHRAVRRRARRPRPRLPRLPGQRHQRHGRPRRRHPLRGLRPRALRALAPGARGHRPPDGAHRPARSGDGAQAHRQSPGGRAQRRRRRGARHGPARGARPAPRPRRPQQERGHLAHAGSARAHDDPRRVPRPDEARSLHEGPAPDPGGRGHGGRGGAAHRRLGAPLRGGDGGGACG